MELKIHRWNEHVCLIHNEIDGWIVQYPEGGPGDPGGPVGPTIWTVADIQDKEKHDRLVSLIEVGAGEEIPWLILKEISIMAGLDDSPGIELFRASIKDEMADRILRWNGADVTDLHDYLLTYTLFTHEDFDQMLFIPTAEPIPPELIMYPVWAVDQNGMALTGSRGFKVEAIDDLRSRVLDEEQGD